MRPSYFNLLNLELREECSRNLPEQLGLQMDTIEEQQLKQTQSGSSSRSGRNREADAIGEQQLKRIDAIGEQQLKQMQSGSSSSAERRRITHVGERGGSS